MRRKYSDFQIITCIILSEKKSDEAGHRKNMSTFALDKKRHYGLSYLL